LAYLICGDWHRAQDAVQQAYIRLYVAWPHTVLSVVRDEARRPWRRHELTSDRLPEHSDVELSGAVDDRLTMITLLQQLRPGSGLCWCCGTWRT
jgi:hypothetical protein